MNNSKTLKNRVSLHGFSLQTGNPTKISLCPSYTHGITFYVNNKNNDIIHCSSSSVIDTTFSTNIGIDCVSVSTVEHLMSALHIYGIDCLDIIVDGDGIPIMDGSALNFCNLIEASGIKDIFGLYKKYITIEKEIYIDNGYGKIAACPYDGFRVIMEIDFKHPLIGNQVFVYDNDVNYKEEIAPARTFIRYNDAKYLMDHGLIQGGSKDNAIVLDDDKVMNTKLKWADEFVRHKVLDFLGDIYMNGPIKGYFICSCSGHKANNKLLREIVK